jgi:hypothetical protein
MPEANMLTLLSMRHLPSVQNVKGRGEANTPLTEGTDASSIAEVLKKADILLTGTLKRHTQTTNDAVEIAKYDRKIIQMPELNAALSGPLLEHPRMLTEAAYGLSHFAPNDGDLYRGNGVAFDPKELGIFPFDPLYCYAYWDKGLRDLVFPGDKTLKPLDKILDGVIKFQTQVLGLVEGKTTIASIGSCSANAVNMEFATYQTVGENMVQTDANGVMRPWKYGANVVFPQQHDQVMIFGNNDHCITPVRGNTYIQELL